MQSSGLVLWLVAVVCACEPCLASSNSGRSHHRPRNSLLALVRAATALHHHHLPQPPLPPPPPSSPLLQQQPQHHHHHHLIPPPSIPANVQLEYPHLYRRHHVATAGDVPQEQQLLPPSFRQHDPDQEQQPQEHQQPGDDQQQQQILADDERGEAEKRRLAWSKRGGGGVGVGSKGPDAPVNGPEGDEGQEEAVVAGLQQVGSSIATNFLRHARSGPRPYDVPRIDCPAAEDQMERFPCPSPDRMGRYRCIDDHVLCDGFIDCPDGEDEDRQQCMFYKTTKAHLDVLADAIIRWARGGK